MLDEGNCGEYFTNRDGVQPDGIWFVAAEGTRQKSKPLCKRRAVTHSRHQT
jgi:hypothetical protein